MRIPDFFEILKLPRGEKKIHFMSIYRKEDVKRFTPRKTQQGQICQSALYYIFFFFFILEREVILSISPKHPKNTGNIF